MKIKQLRKIAGVFTALVFCAGPILFDTASGQSFRDNVLSTSMNPGENIGVKEFLTETLVGYTRTLPDMHKDQRNDAASIIGKAEEIDKNLAELIGMLLFLMPDNETAIKNARQLRRIAMDINLLLVDQGLYVVPMEFRDNDGRGGVRLMVYAGTYEKTGNRYSFMGKRIDGEKEFGMEGAGFTIYHSNISVIDLDACMREAAWIVKGNSKDVTQMAASEFTDPATGQLYAMEEIARIVAENDKSHENGHTERYTTIGSLTDTPGPQSREDETWAFLRQIEKGPVPGYSFVGLARILEDDGFKETPHYGAAREIFSIFAGALGISGFNVDDPESRMLLLHAIREKLGTKDGEKEIREIAAKWKGFSSLGIL